MHFRYLLYIHTEDEISSLFLRNNIPAFPCDSSLLPSPPVNGYVKLLQEGYEFGPCLGRRDVEHEILPNCPVLSVLVMDDELLANGNMKRSVKFDDDCYGLMLDVLIPGEDWRRIRPDQARQARQAVPSLRSGPLELTNDIIAGVVQGGQPSGGEQNGGILQNSATLPQSASVPDGQSSPLLPPPSSGSAVSGSNALPLGRRDT